MRKRRRVKPTSLEEATSVRTKVGGSDDTLEQTEDNILASYQERPLSDAVLKCVWHSGQQTTYQIQFSLPSCAARATQDEPDVYTMKRIMARKNGRYFLEWSDGTTGWEPKKHILDKDMLHEFEARYQGFDDGVDILGSRLQAGKRQFLLHWHGQPSSKNSWVSQGSLSPNAINRFSGGGLE
jgi:hypothetical protein